MPLRPAPYFSGSHGPSTPQSWGVHSESPKPASRRHLGEQVGETSVGSARGALQARWKEASLSARRRAGAAEVPAWVGAVTVQQRGRRAGSQRGPERRHVRAAAAHREPAGRPRWHRPECLLRRHLRGGEEESKMAHVWFGACAGAGAGHRDRSHGCQAVWPAGSRC